MNRTNLKQNHSVVAVLLGLSLFAGFKTPANEPVPGPSAVAAAKPDEILNNSAVIGLKHDGFGENLLVETIKASKCDFDVSIAALKQLKAAGLPDVVISAMIGASSARRTGVEVVEPASLGALPHPGPLPKERENSDPNDPTSPHQAGIWLYEEPAGKPKMTLLEPSVYSQNKTGVGFFMQFGQTVKTESVIRSAHAEIETTNVRPIFYFYFEKTQSGLRDARDNATSPNEYILSKFEVVEKDNHRRLVMGQVNAYAGVDRGADGKSVRSFSFQKLAPGIYKVTPKEDLAGGEYGFYYGGSTGNGKVFDFGVRGNPADQPQVQVAENKAEPTQKTNWFKKTFHTGKN